MLRGRLVPIVPIARARARRIVTVAIRATPCSGGDGREGQRAPPEDHHPLGLLGFLGLDTGGPLVATAAAPKTVAGTVASTVASTVAAAVAATTPLGATRDGDSELEQQLSAAWHRGRAQEQLTRAAGQQPLVALLVVVDVEGERVRKEGILHARGGARRRSRGRARRVVAVVAVVTVAARRGRRRRRTRHLKDGDAHRPPCDELISRELRRRRRARNVIELEQVAWCFERHEHLEVVDEARALGKWRGHVGREDGGERVQVQPLPPADRRERER